MKTARALPAFGPQDWNSDDTGARAVGHVIHGVGSEAETKVKSLATGESGEDPDKLSGTYSPNSVK